MSGAPNPQTGKGKGTFRRSQAPTPGGSPDRLYHLNHADTIPELVPGDVEAQRHASNRAYMALLLAKTPEAWFALIRGQTIPYDQLDTTHLYQAKRRIGDT